LEGVEIWEKDSSRSFDRRFPLLLVKSNK
jgi:hypothetical protein